MTSPPPRSYDAVLFDMDGTLLTSLESAERVWAAWARRHGLAVDTFLPTIHGVQSVETIRRLNLPGIDPVAEAAEITRQEIEDVAGIHPIRDAARFLSELPLERWAVVTSAPRALATARLAAAGLPVPPVIITADDVANGKPAPDCYVLAAKKLGTGAADCLIFEDSPAGIAAAEAAGADVMVVTAAHRRPLETSHRTILDYRSCGSRIDEQGRLTILSTT